MEIEFPFRNFLKGLKIKEVLLYNMYTMSSQEYKIVNKYTKNRIFISIFGSK